MPEMWFSRRLASDTNDSHRCECGPLTECMAAIWLICNTDLIDSWRSPRILDHQHKRSSNSLHKIDIVRGRDSYVRHEGKPQARSSRVDIDAADKNTGCEYCRLAVIRPPTAREIKLTFKIELVGYTFATIYICERCMRYAHAASRPNPNLSW